MGDGTAWGGHLFCTLMAEKKHNIGRGFLIKNIEDVGRQHVLTDIDRPPLILNNQLPIRGADKITAPYTGVEPDRFIFQSVALPDLANIVLSYDADDPGTGNRPEDRGSYDAGNLSSVSGTPTYNASGGPGDLAYWSGGNSDGYRAAGVAKDGVTGVTIAMVCRVTAASTTDRYLFTAANSQGGGGGVVVQAADPGSLVRFQGSGATVGRINASADVGSGWYLYIYSESQTVSKYDSDIYDIGATTPTNTVRDAASVISSTGFGTYVDLGIKISSFSVNGWGIAQVRVWDKKVSADDFSSIAEFFKDYYGL